MHVLNQLGIQVLHHLNLLALQLLVVLVGLLRIILLTEVLDQHRVDIAHLDCILHSWGIDQRNCDLSHTIAVVLIEELACLTELLQIPNLGQEHVLLLLLVRRVTLVKLAFSLNHGLKSLLVGTEFVDFNLGTLIVEV